MPERNNQGYQENKRMKQDYPSEKQTIADCFDSALRLGLSLTVQNNLFRNKLHKRCQISVRHGQIFFFHFQHNKTMK